MSLNTESARTDKSRRVKLALERAKKKIQYPQQVVPEGAELEQKDAVVNLVSADKFKGVVKIKVLRGVNLVGKDVTGKSDPYLKIRLGDQLVKTRVIDNNLNPEWNETFFLYVTGDADETLVCECWDKDRFTKDDHMGVGSVILADLKRNEVQVVEVPLQEVETGHLVMELTYTDVNIAEEALAEDYPRVKRMIVRGGPYHSQPLKVFVEYGGGVQGPSVVQWYRERESQAIAIAGADELEYQPTADDIGASLRCDFTPMRSDGLVGSTVFARVPEEFTTIDPNVESQVKLHFRSGKGIFKVRLVGPVEIDVFMIAEVKQIRFKVKRVQTSSDITYKLTPDTRVYLHPYNRDMLTLMIDGYTWFNMVAENPLQRDVITLTIRAMMGVFMMLHSSHSDRRREEKEAIANQKNREMTELLVSHRNDQYEGVQRQLGLVLYNVDVETSPEEAAGVQGKTAPAKIGFKEGLVSRLRSDSAASDLGATLNPDGTRKPALQTVQQQQRTLPWQDLDQAVTARRMKNTYKFDFEPIFGRPVQAGDLQWVESLNEEQSELRRDYGRDSVFSVVGEINAGRA